ncbi:MAG: hypothetical protein FJ291_23060 [Planctomycetes bacterium]|nr:hypothetical protein [Planctomycetota bacterium]
MEPHVLSALKGAVDSAVEDLVALPEVALWDVLPKESQPQCAMFAFLKGKGCTVHAEATYPQGRGECDLRVRFADGADLWIEIKNAWSAPGWVNKPKEQRARWVADLRKLRRAPENAHRAFVIVGYFSQEPAPTTCQVSQKIYAFHPDQRVHDSPCVDLQWRLRELKRIQAWVWGFSAAELRDAVTRG